MDIDIDFKTNFDPLDYFKEAVRASRVERGELRKHPAGAYLQSIAKDPLTKLAAIPFEEAEKLGYFKIDFLHLSLLDDFESKDEIRKLLAIEPDWSILEKQENVEKLFQLGRQFDVVQTIKPKSIEDLCDCLAIFRPGKKHLLRHYRENKEFIRQELYKKPEKGYYFKKSHSLAYAMNVVLQMHLIKAGIL
jgi:DNA polymerase III alpha subunit